MRLVLDTNTVLALWMFGDPALEPLRQPCEAGAFRLLCNGACLDELQRVLGYSQFKLTPERAAEIHAAYSARIEMVAPPESEQEPLPRCKDRDDQKFLELARDGGAALLVTRDKHLLKLARRKTLAGRFRILTPEKFVGELVAEPSAQ